MSDLINYLTRRLDSMKTYRSSFEDTWDDICRLVQLSNTTVYDDNPKGGNDNAEEAFDSTACYAAQRLAAVINSVMTNQASEWFKLETDNPILNNVKEVKAWLEEATDTVRKELENSNFYTELLPLYYDLATIGTAVMYIEEDTSAERELRFSTRHIKEIFADEDKYGQIDTVFRLTKMTARQMVQRWGEDVSDVVKKAMEEKPDTEYDILHCVYPRGERISTKKLPTNLKYSSVWLDKSNLHILSEGGYVEFPYVVPRWDKLPTEIYGRSPSYIALPDVRTLNQMSRTLIDIGNKAAKPPMFVSGDLFETLDMRPDAINYADGNETTVVPLNKGENVPITVDLIQIKVDRILQIYYNNQLQVINNKDMTAAEVQARTDENWRILGSVFGRLQSELLEKLMARIFSIVSRSTRMDGSSILPTLPEALANATLRLKYVSQLARAQKQSDILSVKRSIQDAMEMAQINPEVLDNINFDEAFRVLADLNGAPSIIVTDKEQMMQIRQARQQQQQMMQQQQMEEQQVKNIKTESEAANNVVDMQKKKEEV